MVDVKGRWALVTGASRGIGLYIARFLAEKGCNLVLHSRDKHHTDSLLRDIIRMDVEAYAVSAELSDVNSINKMLDVIEAKGTVIDILFNNAAIQATYRDDYFKTPDSDYETSFKINTIAPMMICYRIMPQMLERGFGRIINITSGIAEDPHQAGYSASKAALDKVTYDLSTTIKDEDVILTLADPGWCRTDLGGPNAPNAVSSVIPGVVLGAFLDNKGCNGKIIGVQDFAGMSIEEALARIDEAV
ncbi:MAG: SDR family oxidoreductase [Oscillospiraceae bacterium]|nr:SDR family oxidoreductase [Oscillospiraceae bacterium]